MLTVTSALVSDQVPFFEVPFFFTSFCTRYKVNNGALLDYTEKWRGKERERETVIKC